MTVWVTMMSITMIVTIVTVLAIMTMMILMTKVTIRAIIASHRDFGDSDGCSDYGDCDGNVTADASSLVEYLGHDVIWSYVILPQTDSDDSSTALETSIVGAVGTGAPWSQTGGLRGLRGLNIISSLIQGVRRLF